MIEHIALHQKNAPNLFYDLCGAFGANGMFDNFLGFHVWFALPFVCRVLCGLWGPPPEDETHEWPRVDSRLILGCSGHVCPKNSSTNGSPDLCSVMFRLHDRLLGHLWASPLGVHSLVYKGSRITDHYRSPPPRRGSQGTAAERMQCRAGWLRTVPARKHQRFRKGQGRKNSININFLVRISRGHSWPLRPDAQGSKSFSPPLGPQKNALFGADVHDFWRGRPWPEGLSKNFVQKKFALIFWPLKGVGRRGLAPNKPQILQKVPRIVFPFS